MQILILGGTTEGSRLAQEVTKIPGIEVITSLAGRTSQPATQATATRSGGFGGSTGLAQYIKDNAIEALIDATHPFAEQISFNAATAAQVCSIPHLMLVRPQWEAKEGDRWIEVETLEEAAAILPGFARRVFLTIGRQELSTFIYHHPQPLSPHIWFLMRMIDPPTPPIPTGELLLERGPFSLDHEKELLLNYNLELIVSKNSGGDATYAKIEAARLLSLPVVMVKRPQTPECEKVSTVEEAIGWIRRLSTKITKS